MISLEVLREVASGPEPFQINLHGVISNRAALPDETLVPSLVVGHVTDAIKQSESGIVVRYLDRDTMWAVDGFILDREIVSKLADGVASPVGLIEAVRDAGFEWHAMLPMPPESESDLV